MLPPLQLEAESGGGTGQQQAQALGVIPAAPLLEDSPGLQVTSASTTEQPSLTGGVPKSWTMNRFLIFCQSRGALSRDRGTFLSLVLLFSASPQVMNLPFLREQKGRTGLLCRTPDMLHFPQPGSSSWPQSPDHLHVVHDIHPTSSLEQRGSQEHSSCVLGEEINTEETS